MKAFNPIKLHVDTGRDKNKIIYKQILIPLSDTGDTILFESDSGKSALIIQLTKMKLKIIMDII